MCNHRADQLHRRRINMAFYPPAALVVLTIAAVGSVSSSSEVMERTSFYSCCGSPEIRFSPHCEHLWSENGTTIAWSNRKANGCTSPCQRVEGDLMTLDRCVDVYTVATCINEMGVTVEERIHYRSQPCSGAASNTMAPQGSVCVLLPAMILGLCTMKMIC